MKLISLGSKRVKSTGINWGMLSAGRFSKNTVTLVKVDPTPPSQAQHMNHSDMVHSTEMSQRDEISRDISESSSKFLAKNRSATKFRTTFRTKFRHDAEISKADKTMAQRSFAHVGAKIR